MPCCNHRDFTRSLLTIVFILVSRPTKHFLLFPFAARYPLNGLEYLIQDFLQYTFPLYNLEKYFKVYLSL